MDYKMEELLPVVKTLSEQYTSRESTSISYETANRLMAAVLYCLREQDGIDREKLPGQTGGKSDDHHHGGYMINTPDCRSAGDAYRNGYELLLEKVKRARTVYESLAGDFMSFGNKALSETVLKGFPAFFLYYDAKFDPENAVITMDYPVLADMTRLRGGDAVCLYLDCIRLEQIFLKRFPEEVVRDILRFSYSGYEAMFINLSSTVLRRVLVSMMLEKSFSGNPFMEEDYERLGRMILEMKTPVEEPSSQHVFPQREKLKNDLFALLSQFMARVFPEEPALYSYLRQDIPDFAYELLNAAEHGSLSNLL